MTHDTHEHRKAAWRVTQAAKRLLEQEDRLRELRVHGYDRGSPTWRMWEDLRKQLRSYDATTPKAQDTPPTSPCGGPAP